jgi:hypothetical protein
MKYFLLSTREGVAPGGHTSLLVTMLFGGHFGQPMLIAMHQPIGQVMPYQLMHGNWHGLAKTAAKTGSSWQFCCAMVRAVAAACFVVVLCGYCTIHKM